MGPPPFGDGNSLLPLCVSRSSHTPSMGPPPFGDGNLPSSRSTGKASRSLQWGHRLSAMETTRLRRPSLNRLRTFNGATAFRRWKLTAPTTGTTPSLSSFNGATAFRRWKLESGRRGELPDCSPSMGPPPFGDGNHRPPSSPGRRLLPFNGATAFRRWKPRAVQWDAVFVAVLQWGHRLSAMETAPSNLTAAAGDAPSMGPPPFGDGNLLRVDASSRQCLLPSMGPPPFGDGNLSIWDVRCVNYRLPFNGATAFRRWKP